MKHAMKVAAALLIGVLGASVLASFSDLRGLGDHAARDGCDPSLVLSIQRSGNRDDESKLVAALWSDGVLYFSSGKNGSF